MGFELLEQLDRRGWASRDTKPLVGDLMAMKGAVHLLVIGRAGSPALNAVIGQHRIENGPAFGDRYGNPLNKFR